MSGFSSKPVKEEGIHRVEIEDIGREGDGVAKIDGFVVFVPNTQIGDEVRIIITDVGPTTGRGQKLDMPDDTSLPFFAYGIFKQNELGHRRIDEYVDEDTGIDDAMVGGDLIVEDGMALLMVEGQTADDERTVEGSLIPFKDATALNAYGIITASEPMSHYIWDQVRTTDGAAANALVVNPDHNIENIDGKRFHRHEPRVRWYSKTYFEDILPVINDVFEHNNQLRDKHEFFRLQMGYLLLWTALERYISLSWGKSADRFVKQKRERFAREDDGVQQSIPDVFESGASTTYRPLSRSDDPSSTIELDTGDPETVINYFYQVRSNVTHRGKGEPTADEQLLRQSFYDLYRLFCGVLEHQYADIDTPPVQVEAT